MPNAARIDCPWTVLADEGCGKGDMFHEASKGEATANRKCEPNVFMRTVNGEKGYVTVEVSRKADFQ